MDRVLTWHFPEGPARSAAFYMETFYTPEAVRIHAEVAPNAGDCQVDIFCNGVSIFADHSGTLPLAGTAVAWYKQPRDTWAVLAKGDTEELDAEDFTGSDLEAGSWITCSLGNTAGAQNITVHLELSHADEPEEVAE